MAEYALKFTVGSRSGCHALHRVFMTPGTQAVWHIGAVGNLLGHVGIVTLHALSIIFERSVGLFMAFSTLWFVSMSVMVTGITCNIGMPAWMILDLLCLFGMAPGAVRLNGFHLNACKGCMGICVALEALGHLLFLTMRQVMATLAVRHTLIPGKPPSEIVKGLVAEGTLLLMGSHALFDGHVNRVVTPGTLHRGKRLDVLAVDVRPCISRFLPGTLFSLHPLYYEKH